EIHPMVRLLNELGCRAMVVGNHDFNFGLEWIEALRRTAAFPVLGANVIGPDGDPFFQPSLILEAAGKRIGILGVTTPQVPRWEEPWNYRGLTFRDAVETVTEWAPRLRAECDAVIVAAHMGWEGVTDGGLEDPEPHENAVGRMLQQSDDVDVVLMAHTHQIVQCRGARGTLAVQAGWGGQALGEIQMTWDERGVRKGGPRVESRISRAGFEIAVDERLEELVLDEENRAADRVDEVLGTAEAAFRTRGARYRDNAVLSLVNRAQLWASGARVSSTALFRADQEIEAGPVRLRDLFRIYPYENDLTVLEMTVDDLRAYLEEIALTYSGPALNGELPPIDSRISLYNHDSLAGCEYEIDPGRPEGARVTSLTFDGETWPGDRTVTVAVTSYRAQGGGGYLALRRAKVVERTGREIRHVIADYLREQGVVRPEVFDNWRVAGVDGKLGGGD
ncbi:MAG TPA: bifunctional UDP-sugar hydrolase/5'-nucleotidase, partial [bacterium]|nr:bifunctional UDP-sugar hydrolase/5'-nucleotidase [bacterium]